MVTSVQAAYATLGGFGLAAFVSGVYALAKTTRGGKPPRALSSTPPPGSPQPTGTSEGEARVESRTVQNTQSPTKALRRAGRSAD